VKSEARSPKPDAGELVIVALGSNLGDSRRNVLRGMERLEESADGPLLKSSLWETKPVDCPPGSPVFVNAVVGFRPRTGETPELLLAKLQTLEREFGRRPKKVLNEPRPLDLDLIAFAGEVRHGDVLVLPHPRAHERRFVLQPLAEILPDLVLPGQRRTAAELLEMLPAGESVRRLSG
jgi:2-amino-4-hydroxy-6-hydroxymethyldihydropteridine diphosphokinase